MLPLAVGDWAARKGLRGLPEGELRPSPGFSREARGEYCEVVLEPLARGSLEERPCQLRGCRVLRGFQELAAELGVLLQEFQTLAQELAACASASCLGWNSGCDVRNHVAKLTAKYFA